jgi:hypothetical protein
MAAAPAGREKLLGEQPEIFSGDRTKSENFIDQFNTFMMINENHEVMRTPYLRTLFALTLIKGPLVDKWRQAQVRELQNKVNRQQHPIDRADEALWRDFETAFTAAYTDTAKAQNAGNALEQLKMKGSDLDTYTATFKHLVEEAGYDITDKHCYRRYGAGLPKHLLAAILTRDQTPTSFNDWVLAAKTELMKAAEYEAMMGTGRQHYDWRTPRQVEQQHIGHRNGHHHYRNGHRRPHYDADPRPYDPMNVDLPVFTRVNRAYTEQDKNRFKKEGRCFYCDKQGHMARECPQKKYQQPQSQYRPPPSSYRSSSSNSGRKPFKPQSHRPKPQGFRKFNKPRGFGAARSATIEEMDSDQDSIDPPTLAARTAKLSDDQKEEWLHELDGYGVSF